MGGGGRGVNLSEMVFRRRRGDPPRGDRYRPSVGYHREATSATRARLAPRRRGTVGRRSEIDAMNPDFPSAERRFATVNAQRY